MSRDHSELPPRCRLHVARFSAIQGPDRGATSGCEAWNDSAGGKSVGLWFGRDGVTEHCTGERGKKDMRQFVSWRDTQFLVHDTTQQYSGTMVFYGGDLGSASKEKSNLCICSKTAPSSWFLAILTGLYYIFCTLLWFELFPLPLYVE